MRHEQYLRRRRHSLQVLSDAVATMRSISALYFRDARRGLLPARQYRADMELMAAEIGLSQGLKVDGPRGVLAIASDLGLCGDYNSRIADLVIDRIRRNGGSFVICVGRRLRRILSREGFEPQHVYDAPPNPESLPQFLLQVCQELLSGLTEGRMGTLEVVSGRFDGVGHFTPRIVRLLPIEPQPRAEPLRLSRFVDASYVFGVAAREYLYISLYELLLEALAAEHGMRLTAAEAALQWLEGASSQTARRMAAARSESATQELLDIVSGARFSRVNQQPGLGGLHRTKW